MNEADTCRRFVVPKLQAAGWDNELHSIAEQQEIDEYRLAMENEVITPEEPEDAERKLDDSLSSSTQERAGERSRIVKQTAFFGYFAPEAREIMNDLLEKYATDSELQFLVAVRKHLPDVLKVPSISQHGNVAEILDKFGLSPSLTDIGERDRVDLILTKCLHTATSPSAARRRRASKAISPKTNKPPKLHCCFSS